MRNDSFLPEKSGLDLLYSISIAEQSFNLMAKSCGYTAKITPHPFRNSDSIQFNKLVLEIISSERPWFAIGPRQSEQYMILANAAKTTPTVSPLAANSKVFSLGPLHLTMAIENNNLSKQLVVEAKKRARDNSTYISVVRTACVSCKEFADGFDQFSNNVGLKALKRFQINSDTAELGDVKTYIKENRPAFILVPNRWDVSYHVIKTLSQSGIKSIFLGGDTWGDSVSGTLSFGLLKQDFEAIIVRPYPPTKYQLEQTKTCDAILECRDRPPQHSTGASYIRLAESLARLFCEKKPKTRAEFALIFERYGSNYLPLGNFVSVDTVKNQRYTHEYDVPLF